MNSAEQDSRLMYEWVEANAKYPYPESTGPWEWLVAYLDIGPNSCSEESGYLTKWIEFVKDAHTNRTKSGKPQTRGDGSPYYFHPIKVAILASEHFDPMGPAAKRVDHTGLDWKPLCYAFFGHDLFEDTTVTRMDVINVIGKGLGVRTCDFIQEVTKPEKTPQDKGDGWLRYTHAIYSKYGSISKEAQVLTAVTH